MLNIIIRISIIDLTQYIRCSMFIINLLTLGTENQIYQNDVTDIRIEIEFKQYGSYKNKNYSPVPKGPGFNSISPLKSSWVEKRNIFEKVIGTKYLN